MKKLMLSLVVVSFLLGACVAHAGLLNKTDNLKDFINSLEPKAGYIWYGRAFADDIEMKEIPKFSGALYTFQAADKDNNLLRIGSIDLGYASDNKFFLSTMIDSKVFKAFKVELPLIGALDLGIGLSLGLDCEDTIRLKKENILFGLDQVGFKGQLKF